MDSLDDFDMAFGPLTVGDMVPEDITFDVFQNNEEKQMSFKDFRGKWVVVFFYPADFSFVCPTELGELADMYEEFKKEDAEILSFSTDTVYVHKAWHDQSDMIKKIAYPMGADPSHKIAELFGVLIEDDGLARRGTFILSPGGNIRSIEITDNSIGRAASDTLRKIKAAKYVLAHPGNVCPASWDEGKDTLKPGMDLVGKI